MTSSTRLAAGYLGLGLAPGDRVASLMPNRTELLVHYIACMKCGLVAMPLNYRYMAPEIDHALEVGGAKILLAHDERRDDLALSRLAGTLPLGRISYDDTGGHGGGGEGGSPSFKSLTEGAPSRDFAPPKPEDPAIIFFTSGSTGKPKGVCHSFETLGWIVASAVRSFDMGPDDVMMPAGSASHVGGHHLSMMTFAAGGRVVMARSFDGDEILPLLREERPTKMWMLPSALYALIRDHGARHADFASVRACFSGGDKVSDALEAEFTMLAGIAIDEDYGMTEIGIPTVTPPASQKIGSVGPLAPGYQASLRDGDGREVAAGTDGRLWIKFPGNMVGLLEQSGGDRRDGRRRLARYRRRDERRRGRLPLVPRPPEADHHPRRLEHLPAGSGGGPARARRRGQRRRRRRAKPHARRERARLRHAGCRRAAAHGAGSHPVRPRPGRLQGAGGDRRPGGNAAQRDRQGRPRHAQEDGGGTAAGAVCGRRSGRAMMSATVLGMATGRRTSLAGTIGSLLEWYDFTVYGFLAPILGKLFFPADDPLASLLAAFGVFAIGYATRPLGGAVFGHIGDKFGRKPAMIISSVMMGLATLGIGLLPVHAQIGTTAAVLLVVLRIFQGFSVGGEFTDSVVMLAEHAPNERRGFVASWAEMGGIVGMLLGSGIGALTSSVLGEAEMQAWGWRIPFLFGAVIAVFSVVLRRQITESPALAHVVRAAGSPVVAALRHHWRPILRMVCLLLMQGIGFYMVFVYAASYLTEQMHVTTARALDINTLAFLAMLAGAPVAAIVSDRLGRKPVLYFVVVATFVLAWPLWALMHHQNLALILTGQIGFGLLMGLAFGVTPATMIEMLPTEVRCSGVAIGYNLCFGMFGGTTPLIATYLVARTADDFAPAYYLMAVTLVSFIVLLGLPETARKPLS